jgi:hypothetical protein
MYRRDEWKGGDMEPAAAQDTSPKDRTKPQANTPDPHTHQSSRRGVPELVKQDRQPAGGEGEDEGAPQDEPRIDQMCQMSVNPKHVSFLVRPLPSI